MTEKYLNFVDYNRKVAKETNHEIIMKNCYASKSPGATLKNLTDHLAVRWLGLDSSKVDNVSSYVRAIMLCKRGYLLISSLK